MAGSVGVTSEAPASVVYAGIDEAGYGPLLGPLCVGMSVFALPLDHTEAAAPDLWSILGAGVCRTPAESRDGRIAVNDSKKLKLSNDSKAKHPLCHLERGVLAFLSQLDRPHDTDAALLESLGASLGDHDWYAGDAVPLPVGDDAGRARITAARLAGVLESSGVRVADLCARAIDERQFNQMLSEHDSKAAVSFAVIASCIRRVWKSHAALAEIPPRVVVDRQGGRTSYTRQLAWVSEHARVEMLGETNEVSAYELIGEGPDAGRRLRVRFQVEAEASHLPVALASMAAKLVRELAMMRFNRYWCARVTELKPTAGYTTDARRWLRDMRGHAAPTLLAALERRA